MKNVKLESLKCRKCGSTHITKYKDDKIVCDGCSTVFMGDKEEPKNKDFFPRGTDPKVSMGDYIEGTVGVHQYSSSFLGKDGGTNVS